MGLRDAKGYDSCRDRILGLGSLIKEIYSVGGVLQKMGVRGPGSLWRAWILGCAFQALGFGFVVLDLG